MPKFVVIDRTGTLKTVNAKDLTVETLYKKTGFKTEEGFVLQHTWGPDDGLDQAISVYGKTVGRAGQENKYDFPPPIDEKLFFGSCALIGKNPETGEIIDLSESDWEEIYEFLFGGFEDIGSEDSNDEEDQDTDDEIENIQKTTGKVVAQTKQGYVKDGFIVDDEEDEDEEESTEDEISDSDEETEESSEEEEDIPKKRAVKKGRPAKVNASTKRATTTSAPAKEINDTLPNASDLNLDDCESELSEDSYH